VITEKKHLRAMGMPPYPGCLCGAGQGQLDLKAPLPFQLRSTWVCKYLATVPVMTALANVPAIIQELSTMGKTKAS